MHVFSDPKFVFITKIFKSPDVTNVVVLLDKKNSAFADDGYKGDEFHAVTLQNDSFEKIEHVCKKAHLVVINDLSGYHIKLVNKLGKRYKIAWRFFGHELYGKILPEVLGPQTLQFAKTKRRPTIRRIAWQLRNLLSGDPLLKAIRNTSLFLGVLEEEYEYLKNKGWDLPAFLAVPIQPDIPEDVLDKKPVVIVGNSRNLYNNHLEIIDSLAKVSNAHFSLRFFFNYGSTGSYSSAVKKAIEQLRYSSVKIIENFLPRPEYENMYREAAALVHNSYRQMALNNILTALKFGVKLYLSEKNVVFNWLQSKGFVVYEIESYFENDLRNGDLYLPDTARLQNIAALRALKESYGTMEFISDIRARLTQLERSTPEE